MRTAVTISDDLMAKASELTGITGRSALVRAGLEALIQVTSTRRLAALGGTDPDAESAPHDMIFRPHLMLTPPDRP